MYLPELEYFQRYPQGNQISSGKYGKIYSSGNFVIKHQTNIEASIQELNYYSMIDHPNVAKVIHWTYVDSTYPAETGFYFSLNKGILIEEAIKQGLISLKEVSQQLISTITFLNNNRIVHADIKPSNLIYDDGFKLIDFGISQMATPFNNGRNYFIGIAYSEYFRDPEFVETEYNPIESEMYAIARTLYYLSEINKGESPIKIYERMDSSYYTQTGTWLDPIIIACSSFPISDRLNIDEVNRLYGLPIQGSLIETPILPVDSNCGPHVLISEEWLVGVCGHFNVKAKTTFLAIHLFRRSLSLVLPDYMNSQKNLIQLLIITCFYLAQIVYEHDIVYVDDLLYLAVNQYDEDQLNQMIVNTVYVLEGIIITPTYWDYANSFEDLPILLLDTISCEYNPQIIRRLSSSSKSKYVSIKSVIQESQFFSRYNSNLPITVKYDQIPIVEFGQPSISTSNHVPVYKTLENFVRTILIEAREAMLQSEHNNILRLINHFRHWLPKLKLDDAIHLYDTIKVNRLGREVLQKIVQFDINTPIASLRLHPFTSNQVDVEMALVEDVLVKLFE